MRGASAIDDKWGAVAVAEVADPHDHVASGAGVITGVRAVDVEQIARQERGFEVVVGRRDVPGVRGTGCERVQAEREVPVRSVGEVLRGIIIGIWWYSTSRYMSIPKPSKSEVTMMFVLAVDLGRSSIVSTLSMARGRGRSSLWSSPPRHLQKRVRKSTSILH